MEIPWPRQNWTKKSWLTQIHRQYPSVMNQAGKVFVFIAQALEAETLQGQTASRVAAATKALLTAANVDPMPLLQQFSPESQRTIMGYFS